MAIIAVFTLVAEYCISLLEGWVLRWRPPSRVDQAVGI
jgi:ABC-type nitrate/sulfonate/bicarbonate transport system permease component